MHSGRWIGDRIRAGITGLFGVPRENDNGRRVLTSCEERGLCVGNTYFKHSSLHKYTRVARGQEVKKDILQYVLYVRARRGMG